MPNQYQKRIPRMKCLPFTVFALFPALACLIAFAGCGPENLPPKPSADMILSGEPIEPAFVSPENVSPSVSASSSPSGYESSGEPEISPENSENATAESSQAAISGNQDTLQLIMVGDILLHTPVEKSALQQDGSYSYDAIFEDTRDLIAGADIALVNQEVILGGSELGISGYPAFNAPFEVGDDLVEAGFDIVCHATNHALDKGKKGLLNCTAYWQNEHPEITVLGIHAEPADSLTIYEKSGIRIAFLNYTYGTNGIPLPEDMPHAVDLLDREKVLSDIRRAEEEADFTVVCPHWGTEYRLTADDSQKKWTKFFLENGVDLVLGTHPHVIEPIEYLTDENDHKMLVYYSLGNFVNWTSSSGDGIANRMVGGMAQITLERDEDGAVNISDYGVRALVCHLSEGTNGVTVKLLSDYTEALAAENAICSQDPDFSCNYCVNLCNRVWGEIWE